MVHVQSHYSNKLSLDATCRWVKIWGRSDDSLYWIRRPMFFSQFFFRFFFFFGGGGLKLRSYSHQCCSETIWRIYLKFCMSNFPRLILENLPLGFGIYPIRNGNSKFVRLPYLSRKYAFSGFDKQLHKNTGPIFTKFGTMMHHTIGQI